MQRRHLRGVELGLVAVVMALIAVWLALPRPVEPGEILPLPELDRAREKTEREADHERARRARATALPYEVRAVGELVRRYGSYEARGDDNGAERARHDAFDLRKRAQERFGPEPLLALRALQTELFAARLEELGRLVSDDRELSELGGNLPAHARRAGWVADDGTLRLSKQELLTMYRVSNGGELQPIFGGEVERHEGETTRTGIVTLIPGGLVYRDPQGSVGMWLYDAELGRYVELFTSRPNT